MLLTEDLNASTSLSTSHPHSHVKEPDSKCDASGDWLHQSIVGLLVAVYVDVCFLYKYIRHTRICGFRQAPVTEKYYL